MCCWYVPITLPSNPPCFSMVGFCKVPNMSLARTKQDYLVAHGKEERIGFVERILSETTCFQFLSRQIWWFPAHVRIIQLLFFPSKTSYYMLISHHALLGWITMTSLWRHWHHGWQGEESLNCSISAIFRLVIDYSAVFCGNISR